jgi:formylglycine-generating enzyme required for sulfatase activity
MRRGKEALGVPVVSGQLFELLSGEAIMGRARLPLNIRLSFGGALQVPAKDIVSFSDGHFALVDGSRLMGAPTPDPLRIATRFGTLEVPGAALKAIRTLAAPAAGSAELGSVPAREVTIGEPLPQGWVPGGDKYVNSIGMVFMLIPAGEFSMGSEEGDNDEKPAHGVLISRPFYVGKYEVTQGQWQKLMVGNPSHFAGDPNLPVEQVSWQDAQLFIKKLNQKEGGALYRLPTEAEWEYAARAGSTTAYVFGDDPAHLGDYGWYGDNAGGRTHPVGRLKPNTWRLYDLQGNVWEWVQDWYGHYQVEAAVDPQGAPSGNYHVYRGGGWGTFAGNCRVSDRNFDRPDARLAGLGFRLVRNAHPAPTAEPPHPPQASPPTQPQP